jgi:anaerobic selenocysteine-containing dehydrogenase
MSASNEKAIRSICGFCHVNCGIIIHVKDGVISRIEPDPEHPANRGECCAKGLAGKQVAYSPDRLKRPLQKTNSGFKEISWDDALDIIAGKLLNIKEKYGAQTIFRGGSAPVTEENRDGFAQLFSAMGSSSFTGVGHLCHLPRDVAFQSVCGHMPQPDYKNTRLIIMWGSSPLLSRRFGEVGIGFAGAFGKFSEIIQKPLKQGAKLIVIDPHRNKLAEMSHKWLQIKPGTDDALALAMLNVIIGQKLYDEDFVKHWTEGFDRLSEHVKTYTPEWAEVITGIAAKDIREVAITYAGTKPAAIREGNGLDQHTNAVHTTRMIAMLEAITGNLDREGGNIFLPFPRMTPNMMGSKPVKVNTELYPLFPSFPWPSFCDALLTGKPFMPRALMVNHANYMLVQGNGKKTGQALEKLDFLVVSDIFRTATTELADIVLPDTSIYERYSFRGYAGYEGGFLAMRNKVIEPAGESRTVFDVDYALAKRMGLAEDYPWTTNEEWITHRLDRSGINFNDLREKHIIYTTPPLEYKKYLKEGFRTPSGKVELYSDKYASLGYAPMPEYKSIDIDPSIAEKYPFTGMSYRAGNYVHSQFRNIPELRRLAPEELVRIHPADATEKEIRDGDRVNVESPSGRIGGRAKITDEIAPGVILIDFGWGNPGDGGDNINILVNDDDRDPVSCSTSNQRFQCRISRA